MNACSRLVLFLIAIAIAPLPARDVTLRVDNAAAAVAAANKANDLEKKGDLNGAIGYYSAAIKIDPQMYLANYSRGLVYLEQHKYEQAITDFNHALMVSPSFMLAAIKRAEVNQEMGRYQACLAELDHIIALRPRIHTDALARSDRAWLNATCPNPAFRNGAQAVQDATAACKIDSWDNWSYIDTLAAAYAEVGDFEKAVKFEEKAIRKARKDEGAKSAQARLALYQQHKPYRLSTAQ